MAKPEPYKWKPKNPQKYKGDHTNIWVRSSWETKVCVWLDTSSDVICWNSEEIVIPYRDPVDGRYRRYFVDFWAQVRTKDGQLKTYLIEVKPRYQTEEPKKKTRVTKQYINEVYTYAVNKAKWKAATEFALDRGWEFKVLTEEHLGLT